MSNALAKADTAGTAQTDLSSKVAKTIADNHSAEIKPSQNEKLTAKLADVVLRDVERMRQDTEAPAAQIAEAVGAAMIAIKENPALVAHGISEAKAVVREVHDKIVDRIPELSPVEALRTAPTKAAEVAAARDTELAGASR